MKRMEAHALSIAKCASQVEQFENLLNANRSLKERDQILPFFHANRDMAAFIGSYVPDIVNFDRIGLEFDLFGDFACDLVVGDSISHNYLFVEFEDASPGSLFVTKPGKATPEFAPRLEHGLSQMIDWFWKLADYEKTDEYEHRFGVRHATMHGLVVVGNARNSVESRDSRVTHSTTPFSV